MILTISREYGAAGIPVARGVADALGYALALDDVSAQIAARLGTSVEEVERRAEQSPPLAERIAGSLELATAETIVPPPPEVDVDESVRRAIEQTVRDHAAAGDVVILGRCASAILAQTPGLVRVFLYADLDWRVERVARAFGLGRAAARADVDRVDVARKRFARDRYRLAWGNPSAYDLLVDTSRIGIAGSIAAIAAAVRGVADGTPH